MKTTMFLVSVSVLTLSAAGCNLKEDRPGNSDGPKACAGNTDCTSPTVCLDGICTDLKEYCAATGICGLAIAECRCDCSAGNSCPACNPGLTCPEPVCNCPMMPPVTCPEIPAPVCKCPAIPPAVCNCPAIPPAVCNCPAAPACAPNLTCPPAPACAPQLTCPKCPDLINPECRDCTCKGGVTNLTLTYKGTVGATITVTNSAGTLFPAAHVAAGGSFSFTGLGADLLMGGSITVKTCKDTTSGTGGITPSCTTTCTTTVITTDCTKTISIGAVFGDYAVLDGSSKTNGKFCSPDPGGFGGT